MIVKLYKHEVQLCRHLAALRDHNNRLVGVADARQCSQPDIEATGYAGEWALGKLLCQMPDTSTAPRAGGSDFYLDGKEIDCKTSRHPNLAVRASKKPREERDGCLIYVAMQGSLRVLEPDGGCLFLYRGWVAANTLFSRLNLKDSGNGSYYYLPGRDLRGSLIQIPRMIEHHRRLIASGQVIPVSSDHYDEVWSHLLARLGELK